MMNTNEDPQDRQIDELIGKAIGAGRPRFDEEAFATRFPMELATLRSRAGSGRHGPRATVRPAFRHVKTMLAAAAAVIIGVTLLFLARGPEQPSQGNSQPYAVASPADLTTALSLTMAYRQGGLEALEAQCDEVLDLLGPRPASLPLHELYDNGNS